MSEAFSNFSMQMGEIVFLLVVVHLYLQDQYINHIMNETGATVLLRGRGSVTSESLHGEGSIVYYMGHDSTFVMIGFLSVTPILTTCRRTAAIAFILVQ